MSRLKLNKNDFAMLEVADSYVEKLQETREIGLPFDNSFYADMWKHYAKTVNDYLAAYKPKKKPKKGK